ncbi:GtrA family protein [uncultured Pseudoteredinibacter sp.]|uniref:GtrA family protein n=1 Tax=uncultured Pseudoteredinibacter sp. TaxID=1641701 RepID=UPI0026113288|nr:GtrA family protein [uncultured Pseudoteredinibacter sp.]
MASLPLLTPTQLRYGLSIGLIWVLDNIAFLISSIFLDNPSALLVSRVTGALAGYFIHKKVSFKNTKKHTVRTWAKYALVWLIAYSIVLFGIEYFSTTLDIHSIIIKLAFECLVIPGNYLLLKYYVYR